MRSTSVFALFLLCTPLVAGCSGAGGQMASLPTVSNGSSFPSSSNGAATAATTTASDVATTAATGPALGASSAVTATAPATRTAASTVTSAAAAVSFPSDFPSGAVAGAKQRFAAAGWDQGGASSPVVTIDGPGSNGGKTFTYTRTDGTAVVVVYYPTKTVVPTGWLALNLGSKNRIPRTATYTDSGTWADQTPGIGWSATTYLTPLRVTLVDLIGTGATPAPAPSATATARASAAPTSAPHPTPTPVRSASPIPTAAPVDASSCTHFVSNPICRQLPANPKVSPYSSAWAALDFQPGRNYVPSFNAKVGTDPFHESQDSSDPPLGELTRGGASLAVTIVCDEAAWGPYVCGAHGISNKTIDVPANMMPAGNSDHHYSFNDDAAQKEYDFWFVQNVPTAAGQKVHIGAGGVCDWSGDGTNCSGSNATNIAGSLGSITEADFARGESGPHGSFGHAISFAALCADPSYVYPASASDGSNTNGSSACAGHTGAHGRPPEGTRVYLDMSDDQVNAMNLPAYAKAWWRTLDREHQGGLIADTNWSGAPGLSPAFGRDDFSQQAREAGVNPVPFAQVPLGVGTIDMARDIKFCSNGTC